MSDVTGQAADALIDVVDSTTNSAVDILKKATDVAEGLASAPIAVAGKTVESVLDEVGSLQDRIVGLLRSVAKAIKDSPLP